QPRRGNEIFTRRAGCRSGGGRRRARLGPCHEDELQARPVRCVADVLDPVAGLAQRALDLVTLTEAQRRLGGEHRAVREGVRATEGHQRPRDVQHVGPRLDPALLRNVGDLAGPVPPLPGAAGGVAGLEDEPAAGPQRPPRRAASQSSSVRKTCATFPVMVARSASSGGSPAASPRIHRTRSASGLARATSRDASAGSAPTTSAPRPASRQASTPVPQPTSSTRRAPNSATIAAYTSRSLRSGSSAS